jgi:glutaredoxin
LSFCINTRRLLKENEINHQDNIIKDEDKFKYKTSEISTFPQIYYVKNKLDKKKLIGGNSDLEDIIELNNNIKQDTKKMDELIKDFLSTHPKINKKLLLKVLYLINKKKFEDYESNLTGGYNQSLKVSYNQNLKGGYNQNIFNIYSASQLTPDLYKTMLGKVIIFIRGVQKNGFFSSYNNSMEIYEIIEYNISRDNQISLKTNRVQWECHDIYCTMKRRSEVILTPEIIQEKFVDNKFIQFLVTKNDYRIVNKKQQDLTKLKTGDIIPLLSKYGDYQEQYLVSDEDVDADIKNKYFFYITSITKANIIEEKDKSNEIKDEDEDLAEQQDEDKDLAKQEDEDLAKQEDEDLAKQEDEDEDEDLEKPEVKRDVDNSTYQINSFGFEIGYRIDTYPINENKSYDLGTKSISFFQKMIESTTDGNWIILEKFN